MKVLLFVILSIVLCAEWKFVNDLKGNWEIQIETKDLEEEDTSILIAHTNLTNPEEGLDFLKGNLVKEIDGDIIEYDMKIESNEDNLSGTFTISPLYSDVDDDEDEDEDKENEEDVLEFAFIFEKNNIGFHSSVTTFTNGKKGKGVVFFTVISNNAFAFSLVYENKKGYVEKYTAKRINIAQPSFLIKYGPMILMMVLLIVPRFFQGKLTGMAKPPATSAPPAAGGEAKKEK